MTKPSYQSKLLLSISTKYRLKSHLINVTRKKKKLLNYQKCRIELYSTSVLLIAKYSSSENPCKKIWIPLVARQTNTRQGNMLGINQTTLAYMNSYYCMSKLRRIAASALSVSVEASSSDSLSLKSSTSWCRLLM